MNTYGNISPSQHSDLEKYFTKMHYDSVTPFNNIFNNIEDLLECVDLVHCPHSQPQVIEKSYILINHTNKFRESIKSWNCIPAIQKTWINFKA